MPEIVKPQLALNGGELSPHLGSRVDLAKYQSGLLRCRNMIPLPFGGVTNRFGTEFIAGVSDSTKKVRLIPFVFSSDTSQTYMLEFGNLYMRVFKNGNLIESGGSPYSITTTYLEADLPRLNFTQSADTLIIVHPSYPPRAVMRTGPTDADWSIADLTFGTGVATPTLFVAGSAGAIPYAVTAVIGSEESLPAYATGNGAGMTWNAVAGADYYKVYKDAYGAGSYGYIGISGAVTGFTDPTATPITPDGLDSPPTASTPFGSADNYPRAVAFHQQRLWFAGTNNNPNTIYGSQTANFYNFDTSSPLKDDDAVEFTLNALQVNEILHLETYRNDLIVFTRGAEWRVTSSSGSGPITPSDVSAVVESRRGCGLRAPVALGSDIVFVTGSENTVRSLAYEFTSDGYSGQELSIMGHHLLGDREVVSWCWQQHPYSMLYVALDNGDVLTFTYLPEHEVWGWAKHTTGLNGVVEQVASVNTSSDFDEVYFVVRRYINGSYVRCVEWVKPRMSENDIQNAWFLDCAREYNDPKTITAITKASPGVVTSAAHGLSNGDIIDMTGVEGMTELNGYRFQVSAAATDTFALLDLDGNDVDTSGYTTYYAGGYARKAALQVTGLSHLEGETLTALCNGCVVENLTVASGGVTLPDRYSRVVVGLPYDCVLETMELDISGNPDQAVSKYKREVVDVTARVLYTRAFKAGPDEDHLDEVFFRELENFGFPTALYSGDVSLPIDAGNLYSARIVIKNTDPVPMTVLSILPRIGFGEY